MSSTIIQDAENKMTKALEAVMREFNTVRTGRANFALLDGIQVDYYGSKVPINQVANVSIPEARLIIIQPWEPALIPEIEKAIQASELAINPVNDGKIIRLPIPPLTEERRKDLVKLAKKYLEEGKIAVRNVRREYNETLKKMEKKGDFSEDEKKRNEEKIQKLTDNYIKKLDELSSQKEKEIMTV